VCALPAGKLARGSIIEVACNLLRIPRPPPGTLGPGGICRLKFDMASVFESVFARGGAGAAEQCDSGFKW